MNQGDPYAPEESLSAKDFYDQEIVKSIVSFLENNEERRQQRKALIDRIEDVYEKQFEMQEKKMSVGQLIFETWYKAWTKMKALDYSIVHPSVDARTMRAIKAGIDTLLARGGFIETLIESNGAFSNTLLHGDSFPRFGLTNDGIEFRNPKVESIWLPDVSGLRTQADEEDAYAIAFSTTMSLERFNALYPKAKGKAKSGQVPRNAKLWEENRDFENKEALKIELITYYNKVRKHYAMIAGANCYIVEFAEGKKYPFIFDSGEAYLPVAHITCFPSKKTIYSHGLGQLMYSRHLFDEKIDNMAGLALKKSVNPDVFVPVGNEADANALLDLLMLSGEAKEGGKNTILPIVRSMNVGQAQKIDFGGLSQDFERAKNMLTNDIMRMGINLNEIEHPASDTARHAILREEAQNSFVQQIQETNAGNYKFIIEVAIDILSKLPKSLDIPVYIEGKVMIEGKEYDQPEITMGDVANTLKNIDKRGMKITMNTRSGAYPSQSFEISTLDESINALASVAPGSKGLKRLVTKKIESLGGTLDESDFEMEAQPQMPMQEQGGKKANPLSAVNV